MKKPYFKLHLRVVKLVEDLVRTSGGNDFENEQPDFEYSDDAWGGGN